MNHIIASTYSIDCFHMQYSITKGSIDPTCQIRAIRVSSAISFLDTFYARGCLGYSCKHQQCDFFI
jgi:hypothetical protein